MNGCTDAIWQVPIAREPNGVLAGRHQFRERNPGRWSVHFLLLEVDVSQYLTGRAALVDQHIEQSSEFG
jgi:hypothetical protein